MKFKPSLIFVFSLTLICLGRTQSDCQIRPSKLKVEYLSNPLAVDSPHPRLSWQLEPTGLYLKNLSQKGYQILVATSLKNIEFGVGDLWDTKKVLSDRTHIKYNGIPLKSGQRAYWRVKVWDQNDQPSILNPFESLSIWDNGLKIDDWSAHWIGAPPGTQQKALQNISDIDSKVN